MIYVTFVIEIMNIKYSATQKAITADHENTAESPNYWLSGFLNGSLLRHKTASRAPVLKPSPGTLKQQQFCKMQLIFYLLSTSLRVL